MGKIRCVIADDHQQSRVILRRMLEQAGGLTILAEATDGEELVEFVLLHRPQAVFIDISMPKLNGYESIKRCLTVLPDLKIVFITAHSEFAHVAYTIEAVDYIVKPIDRARLYLAVDRVKKALQSRIEQPFISEKKLVLRAEGFVHFIPLNEIIYIEKLGRKSHIYTKTSQYQTTETLTSFAGKLDRNFFQSHRSYIINLNYVTSVKNNKDTYQVNFSETDHVAYVAKNKIEEFIDKVDFSKQ